MDNCIQNQILAPIPGKCPPNLYRWISSDLGFRLSLPSTIFHLKSVRIARCVTTCQHRETCNSIYREKKVVGDCYGFSERKEAFSQQLIPSGRFIFLQPECCRR
ncbi:hypothetical protein FGIG_01300 [Fasciola gigantica]|uniref:Uncharacterized protein n=1 Tax=Fasciola gigantica TaxID=46835 RepID=A0A504YN16_FASGI|nr:hypothetical protein FGIG_01300 [Fasciola gigantica]